MGEFTVSGGLGPPVLRATIRGRVEDFVVEEIPAFEPDGQGEHLHLWVEKRGANTAWVARELAQWAGVEPRAVAWAGLKDRHAVTRQSFSIHLPGREAPADPPEHPEYRVLRQSRHARKLVRGALRGNRFELQLREVQGQRSAIEARLEAIRERGVPNRFGPQRFGHDGANIAAARDLFAGRRFGREKRALLISAARSWLFNAVLGVRVEQQSWDQALAGEVFMLEGSHSVFGPEPLDDGLRARLLTQDIHPTAMLWGRGELRSAGAVRAIEQAVADAHPELVVGLEAAGLKQQRRALRVRVADLVWDWNDVGLRLEFTLPAGSYATAVLAALGLVRDAAASSGDS